MPPNASDFVNFRTMTPLEQLSSVIVAGKFKEARPLTQQALDAGIPPADIIDRALVPAMALVGEKFKCNQIFVPEMLVSARAMKEALALLEPRLVSAGITPKFTAVIGTVQGDLHDIGKNLVAMMWKGANFRVVDLGANVAPERFVAAVAEHRPHVVGLSALLTTTMPAMVQTVRALRSTASPPVKIMIGGAPISADFAAEIGADAYAPDAASAVDQAQALLATLG